MICGEFLNKRGSPLSTWITTMSIKKNISDVLLETIDYVVKQNMKNYIGNFVKSVVKAVNNGKYTVSINGADYDLVCGVGVSLKAGDTVLVHIPNNQFKDAYICALLKSCKL